MSQIKTLKCYLIVVVLGLLICCCAIVLRNQGSQKTVSATEKTDFVLSAELSSDPESGRNWQDAYEKGVALHKQGDLTGASYYFSNALGASPGNFTVVKTYCETMLDLSKREGVSENQAYDISTLQIIEGFLQSQIPLVKTAEVESVLGLLEDVRTKITQSELPVFPQNPVYDELITKLEDGTCELEIPDDTALLMESLENLNSLREYAAYFHQKSFENLDVAIVQTEAAIDFQTLSALLEKQKQNVETSCETSISIAEYQFQECEQRLREMVTLVSMLPEKFINELNAEYDALRLLSEKIAETKGAKIWVDILPKLNEFKNQREKITEKQHHLGICQQKLENLQQEATFMQNTIPLLSGKSLQDAVDRINALKEEGIRLNNEQSRKYNVWAMGEIKKCLEKGKEGVGVFANGVEGRRTIGAALIDHLGSIDRRYLTSEVSRCYDEVMGKYLAPNQLNPVKTEEDLNEEGTILHTLNKMHEKKKIQLSQF